MFEPSRLDWAKDFVGEPLKAAGAKPYTLEHLIRWLEAKNPRESYDYTRPDRCLVAQAFGEKDLDADDLEIKIFPGADYIAFTRPWNFGAALIRARSFLQAEGGSHDRT